MSWQHVGSGQYVHTVQDIDSGEDLPVFDFNGNEGHISISYTIHKTDLGNELFRCRVQFLNLHVHDDKEIGTGDWRITTRVNSRNCVSSPEEHWSVGTDGDEPLRAFRTVTLPPNGEIVVYCRAAEEDS
jgi:hypothetical protein